MADRDLPPPTVPLADLAHRDHGRRMTRRERRAVERRMPRDPVTRKPRTATTHAISVRDDATPQQIAAARRRLRGGPLGFFDELIVCWNEERLCGAPHAQWTECARTIRALRRLRVLDVVSLGRDASDECPF